MTRNLLTAIFLTLFSQTAWAAEVYLCKTLGFASLNFETLEVTTEQVEKVSYPSVTDYDFKIVELKIGGHFNLIINYEHFVDEKKGKGLRWFFTDREKGKMRENRALFERINKTGYRVLTAVVTGRKALVTTKSNCIEMKK